MHVGYMDEILVLKKPLGTLQLTWVKSGFHPIYFIYSFLEIMVISI